MKIIKDSQQIISSPDLLAFSEELQELKSNTPKEKQDEIQFKRMIVFNRFLGILGLLLCAFPQNSTMGTVFTIISILCLSLYQFSSWTIIAHHWSHRAYQEYGYLSAEFARGKYRFLQWFDCIVPEAWHYEHDLLHHYHLGELHGEIKEYQSNIGDPDLAQEQAWWLQNWQVPYLIKVLIILLGSMFWKIIYYAPNTLNSLLNHQQKTKITLYSWALWHPLRRRFWEIMFQAWLPYLILRYVLVPLPFLWISIVAWQQVLFCLVFAELISNIHTFLVIVPNHTGKDLYRFESKINGKADFYVRQIIGSCNYPTNHSVMDFLYGYLNYQIEHHVWPELTLGQYRRIQPKLKALCEKYHLPYVQESLTQRVIKTIEILTTKPSEL